MEQNRSSILHEKHEKDKTENSASMKVESFNKFPDGVFFDIDKSRIRDSQYPDLFSSGESHINSLDYEGQDNSLSDELQNISAIEKESNDLDPEERDDDLLNINVSALNKKSNEYHSDSKSKNNSRSLDNNKKEEKEKENIRDFNFNFEEKENNVSLTMSQKNALKAPEKKDNNEEEKKGNISLMMSQKDEQELDKKLEANNEALLDFDPSIYPNIDFFGFDRKQITEKDIELIKQAKEIWQNIPNKDSERGAYLNRYNDYLKDANKIIDCIKGSILDDIYRSDVRNYGFNDKLGNGEFLYSVDPDCGYDDWYDREILSASDDKKKKEIHKKYNTAYNGKMDLYIKQIQDICKRHQLSCDTSKLQETCIIRDDEIESDKKEKRNKGWGAMCNFYKDVYQKLKDHINAEFDSRAPSDFPFKDIYAVKQRLGRVYGKLQKIDKDFVLYGVLSKKSLFMEAYKNSTDDFDIPKDHNKPYIRYNGREFMLCGYFENEPEQHRLLAHWYKRKNPYPKKPIEYKANEDGLLIKNDNDLDEFLLELAEKGAKEQALGRKEKTIIKYYHGEKYTIDNYPKINETSNEPAICLMAYIKDKEDIAVPLEFGCKLHYPVFDQVKQLKEAGLLPKSLDFDAFGNNITINNKDIMSYRNYFNSIEILDQLFDMGSSGQLFGLGSSGSSFISGCSFKDRFSNTGLWQKHLKKATEKGAKIYDGNVRKKFFTKELYDRWLQDPHDGYKTSAVEIGLVDYFKAMSNTCGSKFDSNTKTQLKQFIKDLEAMYPQPKKENNILVEESKIKEEKPQEPLEESKIKEENNIPLEGLNPKPKLIDKPIAEQAEDIKRVLMAMVNKIDNNRKKNQIMPQLLDLDAQLKAQGIIVSINNNKISIKIPNKLYGKLFRKKFRNKESAGLCGKVTIEDDVKMQRGAFKTKTDRASRWFGLSSHFLNRELTISNAKSFIENLEAINADNILKR